MGFLSRLFLKRTEQEFDTCLRLIEVDLYTDLRTTYGSQMNEDDARTLAALVVSFLKGEDIDEIARVSDEPLRSRIMAVLPQVEQRAEECMQTDPHTREIIVATLRMTSVLMFGKYGKAWFRNPAKTRIEKLLVKYGPEFPQEITPSAYQQLTGTYHALKDKWAELDLLDSLGEQLDRASATQESWQRELPSILESPEMTKLLKVQALKKNESLSKHGEWKGRKS
jgi:hypothetical protein